MIIFLCHLEAKNEVIDYPAMLIRVQVPQGVCMGVLLT